MVEMGSKSKMRVKCARIRDLRSLSVHSIITTWRSSVMQLLFVSVINELLKLEREIFYGNGSKLPYTFKIKHGFYIERYEVAVVTLIIPLSSTRRTQRIKTEIPLLTQFWFRIIQLWKRN
jgi:hypothetical protein